MRQVLLARRRWACGTSEGPARGFRARWREQSELSKALPQTPVPSIPEHTRSHDRLSKGRRGCRHDVRARHPGHGFGPARSCGGTHVSRSTSKSPPAAVPCSLLARLELARQLVLSERDHGGGDDVEQRVARRHANLGEGSWPRRAASVGSAAGSRGRGIGKARYSRGRRGGD